MVEAKAFVKDDVDPLVEKLKSMGFDVKIVELTIDLD